MSFHRREAPALHRAKTEISRGFEVKRSMQAIYRALDLVVISTGQTISQRFSSKLHKEGFSGRIDFSQGNIHKQVFLDKGELVGARSNADEDRYERHLLRTGKITRARYQRLRR